jgi:hypothetical protein
MELGKCCVPGSGKKSQLLSLLTLNNWNPHGAVIFCPLCGDFFPICNNWTVRCHDNASLYSVHMYRPCALFSWSIHLDNASLIDLWTMQSLDDSSLRRCTVILFSSRYLLSAKSICPICKQTIYISMQNMRAAPSNQ